MQYTTHDIIYSSVHAVEWWLVGPPAGQDYVYMCRSMVLKS